MTLTVIFDYTKLGMTIFFFNTECEQYSLFYVCNEICHSLNKAIFIKRNYQFKYMYFNACLRLVIIIPSFLFVIESFLKYFSEILIYISFKCQKYMC